jgi:hypothetical protein
LNFKSTQGRNNVCHLTGLWFSPDSPVSSTIKTDRHDVTEILLKVALNTIKPNQYHTPFLLEF